MSQIAGSIAEFGFVNPILVGDDNVIIAGHGRLLAAKQLGLEQVPLIVLEHLTEAQRKARLIKLDPKYVDVIIRRWQAYTGAEAVLAESGEDFATVTAERLQVADEDDALVF